MSAGIAAGPVTTGKACVDRTQANRRNFDQDLGRANERQRQIPEANALPRANVLDKSRSYQLAS
ncbi:MAG: hypothetical protein ACLP9L_18895 [Thermoguttaceae bacterium]